jgi:hypothetical protein
MQRRFEGRRLERVFAGGAKKMEPEASAGAAEVTEG